MRDIFELIKVEKGTFADIGLHLVIGILGFFVGLYLVSFKAALIFFMVSVLIDLDHFLDYFLYFKRGLSLKKFIRREYVYADKLYIPLHSWELVIFVCILSFWWKDLVYVSLGLAVHIASDQIFHRRKNPLIFSLFYRWHKRFVFSVVDPRGYDNERKRLQK